jgi:alkylation response protein AidB-like acyl-CoA dehydrogenase
MNHLGGNVVASTNETQPETVAAANEISLLAQELAAETDRQRALPAELVGALRSSGLLRAGAPLEVEGAELAPDTALRCAERVARGDASAGWCVSIQITSSLLAAYLPEAVRAELFGGGQGIRRRVGASR